MADENSKSGKNVFAIGMDVGSAQRSINDLQDQISGPLRDAVRTTVNDLENAIVRFARTGELNVREMVNSIIADLARIAFNSFVEEPLTNLLNGLTTSFTKGLTSAFGSGSGLMPLPGVKGTKALGGPVSFGRPYVVGEQGRELFVPETSGRIVPNNAMGGSIVFNVQAKDADSFRRSESQIAAMLHRVASRGQRNL